MKQESLARFLSFQSNNRKSAIQSRKSVGCLAILLLLTGRVRMADAQQAGKIFRIGILDQKADLPVQQAAKFEFIINLRAAKQIGLTLSPEFLARANQVSK
jgi:hypothetical protein